MHLVGTAHVISLGHDKQREQLQRFSQNCSSNSNLQRENTTAPKHFPGGSKSLSFANLAMSIVLTCRSNSL